MEISVDSWLILGDWMNTEPFFAPDQYVTEAFTVRSYVPGDGPLLAEAVNASYEHLTRFLPWAKPHTDETEAEQTVRRFRGEYLLNTNFVLGIFSPDGKRLLGGSGFHLREGDLSNRAAEIGMWIRADAARQGLGTRGCARFSPGASANGPGSVLPGAAMKRTSPAAAPPKKLGCSSKPVSAPPSAYPTAHAKPRWLLPR